ARDDVHPADQRGREGVDVDGAALVCRHDARSIEQDKAALAAEIAHVEIAAAARAEQRAAAPLGGLIAEELRKRVELLGNRAAGLVCQQLLRPDRRDGGRRNHALTLPNAGSGDDDFLQASCVLGIDARSDRDASEYRRYGPCQSLLPATP